MATPAAQVLQVDQRFGMAACFTVWAVRGMVVLPTVWAVAGGRGATAGSQLVVRLFLRKACIPSVPHRIGLNRAKGAVCAALCTQLDSAQHPAPILL